jgi:hypothetical protein
MNTGESAPLCTVLPPPLPLPPPSQLMSYGSGSGESYISDLTLAFLEDTGHYVVANGTGGRLVADIEVTGQCNSTGSTSKVDLLFGNDQGTGVR